MFDPNTITQLSTGKNTIKIVLQERNPYAFLEAFELNWVDYCVNHNV